MAEKTQPDIHLALDKINFAMQQLDWMLEGEIEIVKRLSSSHPGRKYRRLTIKDVEPIAEAMKINLMAAYNALDPS